MRRILDPRFARIEGEIATTTRRAEDLAHHLDHEIALTRHAVHEVAAQLAAWEVRQHQSFLDAQALGEIAFHLERAAVKLTEQMADAAEQMRTLERSLDAARARAVDEDPDRAARLEAVDLPFVVAATSRLDPGAIVGLAGTASARIGAALRALGLIVAVVEAEPAAEPEPTTYDTAVWLGFRVPSREEVDKLRAALSPGGELLLTMPWRRASGSADPALLERLLDGWRITEHRLAVRAITGWVRMPASAETSPHTEQVVLLRATPSQ